MSRPGRTTPSTTQIGARAEDAAQRFLESQGMRPVARNFRCRAGELDLVMLDGPVLVMVEVRYRARPGLVQPGMTVTAAKRLRLLGAASWFLATQREYRDHAVRFDVLALSGQADAPRCEWFREAFTADDAGSRWS